VIGTTQFGVEAEDDSNIYNGGTNDSTALIESARGVYMQGGSLFNYGTIIGQKVGPAYAGVTNQGAIFNGAPGDSHALIEGAEVGILFSGTVRNFGTIAATATGGYAVKFTNGSSTLTVEPGSKLIGKVNGGGGALDFASATTGVISGIGGGSIVAGGVDYQDFGTLDISPGASFSASGTESIAVGGVATLAVAGTLAVGGALIVTSSLVDTGVIDGSGHLDLEGGNTKVQAASLTIAHALVSGASTVVEIAKTLTYSGAWDQTSGTITVDSLATFKLSGAADSLSGTLTGAGIVDLTGAGDTLKSLTLSAAKTQIPASSATLSGVLGVTKVLSVSSPDLKISGTTQFTGGGTVQLSNLATNVIVGAATTSLLENSDRIEGAGQLGDGQLILTNEAAGTILANGTVALVINTGAERFVNGGLVEAAGAGGLTIDGAVTNAGVLETHGGTLTVKGAVSGAGKVTIEGGEASFAGAVSQNVAFVTTGELALAHSQTYAATISGFSKTGATSLDLEDISFTGAKASYSGTSASGVLTVTDGTHTARIKLAGNYTASAWTLSSDGHGGVIVVDPPASGAIALVSAIAGFAAAPAVAPGPAFAARPLGHSFLAAASG
jgi:hypothetical protein